ncbi:glycosyltransferase [Anaerolineales bacterium HSG24]|nr:glycosyltransferase [Anaerolineales bacterium HSG24]
MKIALAHDWLNQMGGAEKVLECLVDMFPQAPIYTTIYAPDLMPTAYQQWNIRSTWLNHAPLIGRHHQPYLPFYPLAVQSMDVRGYDLILSNKSGFIHGLRHVQAKQKHVCYCLAPTRYVWDYDGYAAREGFGQWLGLAMSPLINALRKWDYVAAQRVDRFIAISREIQQRIKRYYNRDSVIIYPPVNTDRFQPLPAQEKPDDYYLIVSRLIPYKRIDLAVQACSRLGKRLIVVGDGRDRATLEAMAGPTIQFTGRLPIGEVVRLMATCRAFFFPGFEDFGIAPVEAQAAGRPVIAFAKGGALDTVIEGLTGLFFYEQTIKALMAAIEQFETIQFDSAIIRTNAERFSETRFRREIISFIEETLASS